VTAPRRAFSIHVRRLRQAAERAVYVLVYVFIAVLMILALISGVFLASNPEPAHERWEAWIATVSANTLQAYETFLQKNPSTFLGSRSLDDVAQGLLQHQYNTMSADRGRSSGKRCRLFLVYHRVGRDLRPRGFVDASGSLVIADLRFDEVRPFSGGLAAVKRDSMWGFIDSVGYVRVPPQFDNVRDLSEDRAAVYSSKRCGYIDGRGTMVIPATFHECSSFRDGRALVRMNNPDPPPEYPVTAIINSSGRVLKDLGWWGNDYWEVDPPFSEGVALIRRMCLAN
jgi:WG repeat protein